MIHETARIPVPGVRWVTLSGRTLVSLGEENVIDSFNLIARAPVFVLRRPAAGWQVLTSPQPRAFVQTAPGQDATDYGLDPASQLGATTAFLALELTLAAAKGAPALASLRALVPRGLGGGSRPRTIALKPSKRTAAVTLRRLHPSAALRRLVRRIAAHGGRARRAERHRQPLKRISGHADDHPLRLGFGQLGRGRCRTRQTPDRRPGPGFRSARD